jgi:hypothetical protein
VASRGDAQRRREWKRAALASVDHDHRAGLAARDRHRADRRAELADFLVDERAIVRGQIGKLFEQELVRVERLVEAALLAETEREVLRRGACRKDLARARELRERSAPFRAIEVRESDLEVLLPRVRSRSASSPLLSSPGSGCAGAGAVGAGVVGAGS